ncbi:MAG: family NAD(P)-dependent oxidoreductase [Subtercola sp.]|nr:family NAD(P)-dependent oxidoreductase [Subtercola sp.]
MHGRDRERAESVVADIRLAGGKARSYCADLADPGALSELVHDIGAIDILVNNAGHSRWGATADLTVDELDGLYFSNVRAPFLLVAGIAPVMAARGSGCIVSVSSMSASIGLANGAAYGAMKAAIVSLTKAWAVEFGPAGVRVNAVAPGPTHTRPDARESFDATGAQSPLGRAAHPDEIADAILFLASPRASYITGATLAVDGGRTAL